jgi:endonuclease G
MSLVQVGVFAGGIAVGATGAFLLRSSPPPRPIQEQQQVVQQKIDPRLIESGYQPEDGQVIGPGGNPGPVSDFLRQAAYISSYDRRLRHPSWTAEHLTAASLTRPPGDNDKPDRKNSVFREDERIPLLFRARLADYFRSGYDRGHMVPAADAKISQEAMNETFKLSNIAPQVGEGFNRDYWAHTEDFVRRLVPQFGDIYVFTLPLYLPRQNADGRWRVTYEVIGDPPNISVPTHFAKVIYATGLPSITSSAASPLSSRGSGGGGLLGLGTGMTALGAFVMPNAVIPNEAPLTSFVVPVEAVERAAGLTLFPASIKSSSRPLCDVVDCRIIVRDFSNRNSNNNNNQQQKKPALLDSPSR